MKQMIEIPTNAKKYMMQKNYQPKEPGNIIDYIDPVYLEIAAEIIKEATIKFNDVKHDIYFL